MAPKSAKDKMREYRARMSQEKRDSLREKDQIRKVKIRAQKTPKEKKIANKKCKLAMQKLRLSRKVTPAASGSISPFKSVQSLGKAISRAKKALPSSPRRRCTVIKKLAFNVPPPSTSSMKNGKSSVISEETARLVTEFYTRDDISRFTPGRKEFVKVILNGFKEKMQKRYIIMTVSECYELFKVDHTDIVVGKSKFFSLRPPYCLPISKTPANMCTCLYHENMELLLESL